MANTIIRIKSSGVTGNVPQSLQPGEIAINYVDGKIFYGNSTNQTVLFDAVTEPSGLNGELQFNSFGSFGSDPGLVYSVSNKTLVANNIVVANVNVAPTIISAYIHANSAYEYANALSGGTATDGVARVLANNALLHANSAYMHANAAFIAANNSVDTWVRDAANSASSYANSAFAVANTSIGSLKAADFFPPLGDWGLVTEPTYGVLDGEVLAKVFDCKEGPKIYLGYEFNLDFGYLS